MLSISFIKASTGIIIIRLFRGVKNFHPFLRIAFYRMERMCEVRQQVMKFTSGITIQRPLYILFTKVLR